MLPPYPSHAPANFDCVFCRIVREAGPALAARLPSDVIYQSELGTAFLALHRWPGNPLNVLVIPNEHYENLYTLPVRYAEPLHILTRAVALALKGLYNCDGISTRQHNEPAGNQDAWHYHMHVTPRYHQDNFYRSSKIAFPEEERLAEGARLRDFIAAHQAELFEP